MKDERLNVIDCIQGDPIWIVARAGHVGGSRVADVVSKLKRKEGESAARRNCRIDIIAERLTGQSVGNYVSADMEWGREMESVARAAYEQRHGVEVDLVGYVLHPTIEWAGVSPDGLVGMDGMVEFKCPRTTTHVECLLNGGIPAEYLPQMYWEMACCPGRQWNDFVSFDPRVEEDLQLYTCRLYRDDTVIAEMEAEVVKFLAEVEAEIGKLSIQRENQGFSKMGRK